MISAEDNCFEYSGLAVPAGWMGSSATAAKLGPPFRLAEHGQCDETTPAVTSHWHHPATTPFYFCGQPHHYHSEGETAGPPSEEPTRDQSCIANSSNSTYLNGGSGGFWHHQRGTPGSVVSSPVLTAQKDESAALSGLENWSTQRRRCAHSVIERRYRSSINERIAELKNLVAGEEAKLSKSAILRTAIEQLKRLRESNDSLRAENEHLQRLLSERRRRDFFSQSEHGAGTSGAAYVHQPTNFDSSDWLNGDANVAAEQEVDISPTFPYQAKVTLFALMACFIISNPAQLLGGGTWSRQLERSFDFSRFFSAVIGNSVHRVLLLLVVNLLVIIFVMTKLCYGWRESSTEHDKRLWSICVDEKKSADKYLRRGNAKVALRRLISCATTLQAISKGSHLQYGLFKILLLRNGCCQADSRKATFAATVYHDLHKLTLAGIEQKKLTFSGWHLSLLSLRYLRTAADALDKLTQAEIFILAAFESARIPFFGKLFAGFLLRKARQAYGKSDAFNGKCWLYSPVAGEYIKQLKLPSSISSVSQWDTSQFYTSKLIYWLEDDFKKTALLRSYQLLLSGQRDPISQQYLQFVVSAYSATRLTDWGVHLIKLVLEEVSSKDDWTNASPMEADLAKYRSIDQSLRSEKLSSLEDVCFLALRAKQVASTDGAQEAQSTILNWCERCAGSVQSMVTDDEMEELLQCLAVQWCIEACVLLIEAHQQKGLECQSPVDCPFLKKTMSNLVKIERSQASRHPFLKKKLSCHEKLKLLLDMGNPVKSKYALVGFHSKECAGSGDLCRPTRTTIQEWLSLIVNEAVECSRVKI